MEELFMNNIAKKINTIIDKIGYEDEKTALFPRVFGSGENWLRIDVSFYNRNIYGYWKQDTSVSEKVFKTDCSYVELEKKVLKYCNRVIDSWNNPTKEMLDWYKWAERY